MRRGETQRPGRRRPRLEGTLPRRLVRATPCLHGVPRRTEAVTPNEGVAHRTDRLCPSALEHLHEAAQRPNIGLRFLPFDAGAHAAGAGRFVILGRGDEREPLNSMTAVCIEIRLPRLVTAPQPPRPLPILDETDTP
ncbi:Scr1 family TA system antitoxin-like transcriptional regulator [Streptomyces sp. NPDC057336]|uniref:Scr1 family TA system antitoxin-like transcriptional regulator n=1 Tax=Streptomyces sp. NPDC057336 TaxID=3346102 RepID=UPI00362A8605